jgi:hypothetical protein
MVVVQSERPMEQLWLAHMWLVHCLDHMCHRHRLVQTWWVIQLAHWLVQLMVLALVQVL